MTTPISPNQIGAGFASLTAREREFAVALCLSGDRGTVASQLGITVRTYDSHRYRVLEKVGARTVAELVRFAIREGFISMHDEAP